ncbi:hypothetical protein AB833_04320 [Chromatiales bacterium (ex Bugula neritina AB1)]|nr:hypothetical protein AB833_04320 [Chromatiales bacterium (ex Bugula neritina AB1)]
MILLWIGALQSAARWLELLAFGVYIYDLTGSPLLVTLVTLAKLAPLAIFGPVAGALPSRYTSRSLYLLGLTVMLVTTLAALLASLTGGLSVWQVMLISFTGGVFWVLDFPVRKSLIGDAVPVAVLGKAMGFDTIANNGTRMLGPVLGGMLLQFVGLTGVLGTTLCMYIICFVLTIKLQLGRELVSGEVTSSLADSVRQGLQVVRLEAVLSGTLMVTVIYNLFGFPMLSLVPVLGRDELQLSASVIGLLASMEGAGALLGGILFLKLGRVRYFRKIYVVGVAGGLVFGMVYAASTSAMLMGFALLLIGVGSACFAAMQSTLLILNSEARYRSQVFGMLSLSIGSGIIGFTQIGLVAGWFGPRAALLLSSVIGLICLFLVCRRWPQIIGVQPE